jgi:hypothetical protein
VDNRCYRPDSKSYFGRTAAIVIAQIAQLALAPSRHTQQQTATLAENDKIPSHMLLVLILFLCATSSAQENSRRTIDVGKFFANGIQSFLQNEMGISQFGRAALNAALHLRSLK